MVIRIFRLLVIQVGVAAILTANLWSQEATQSFESQNGFLTQQQFLEAQRAFKRSRLLNGVLAFISMKPLAPPAMSRRAPNVYPEGVVQSRRSAQDFWAPTMSSSLLPAVRS